MPPITLKKCNTFYKHLCVHRRSKECLLHTLVLSAESFSSMVAVWGEMYPQPVLIWYHWWGQGCTSQPGSKQIRNSTDIHILPLSQMCQLFWKNRLLALTFFSVAFYTMENTAEKDKANGREKVWYNKTVVTGNSVSTFAH